MKRVLFRTTSALLLLTVSLIPVYAHHELASNTVLDPLPLLTELGKRDRAQKQNTRQSNTDSVDHG